MANPLGSFYLKLGSFIASKASDAISSDGFSSQDDNKEDVAVADLGVNDTPCIEFKDEDILQYIDDISCTPKERRTSALSYQSRYYNGKETYEHRAGFNKYNLRIGDSCFYVPPSYINVSEISNTVREPGIRMSSSVKINHAYSTVDINIEMYFNGDKQINGFEIESPFPGVNYYIDGLRPFIAQCKLSPIMPVENEFLNLKNGIYSIAIQSVTISTVPGFPKLLKVLINAVECNHSVYTMTPDYMFSDLIDWDLYRYNYQRILTDIKDVSINEGGKLKVVEDFSSDQKFSISILSDLAKVLDDDILNIVDFTKLSYTTLLDNETNEFIIQQMNFGLSNIIINTQLNNHTKPATQYLGGNDSVFTIQISTSNEQTVSLFKGLIAKTKYMAQKLRESTGTGFLKVENSLINMLGINLFLLENINIETVPDFPNLNLITLECVSYDTVTALAEELDGFNPFPDDRAGTEDDTIKQTVEGLYKKINQDSLAEIKMCEKANLYPDLMLPKYSELDSVITLINKYREKKGVAKLPFEKFPKIVDKDYKFGKPQVYSLYVNPDYYFLYPYNNLSETIDSLPDVVIDSGTDADLTKMLSANGYADGLLDVIKEKMKDVVLNKDILNKVINHTYYYTLENIAGNMTFNLSSFFGGANSTNNGGQNNNGNGNGTNNQNVTANSATEAFLQLLWAKVDTCGYLYGANGQICTQALAAELRKQHGAICRLNEKWLGKQVFDCSGYVAWGMRETGYTEVPARTPHTGLLPFCTIITKEQLQPGDLLFSSGHVAVYVGNNETIEAMGADYGVCKGKLRSSFTTFARINWPQSVIDKWKSNSNNNNNNQNNNNNDNNQNNNNNNNNPYNPPDDSNLNIEKMLISYNYSKRNDSVKYIVIHDTGNTDAGANVKSHFNYFNGCNRKASADYFVDDHSIGQFVEEPNKSWHCGDGGGAYGITNDNSVGIEICINSDGNYTSSVQNAINLTKYLMKKYNVPYNNVVRHYDASRKNCPATMSSNNWEKWNNFKKMILSTTTTTSTNTTTTSTTKKGLKAPSNMPNSAVEPNRMSTSNKSFIDKIVSGAVSAYSNHNILPSLTLAQAALESGWGKYSIGNNIFGIKATSEWKKNGGKTKWAWTYEEENGVKKKYYLEFRDYDSMDDSVSDHAKLLLNSRYSSVRQATNYKEACERVQAAGYATDSSYASLLISVIESNGLAYWDGYEGYASAPNLPGSGSNGSTQTTITLGKYGDNRDRHDELITQACKTHGMSPNWFKALMTQESSMNEKSGPNSCGAVGLMQITRDPCSELGVSYDIEKLKDPAYNMDIGMRYLKKYKEQVKGNYLDLACLHNCGPGRFAQYQKGTKDLPSETVTHRGLVQKYYNQLIAAGGQEGEYIEGGGTNGVIGGNNTTPSGENANNEVYTVKTVHKVVKKHGMNMYSNSPTRIGVGKPSYQMPYTILNNISKFTTSEVTADTKSNATSDTTGKEEEVLLTINSHTLPVGIPLTDYSPINYLLKNPPDSVVEDVTKTYLPIITPNKNIISNAISFLFGKGLSEILKDKKQTDFEKAVEDDNDDKNFLSESSTSKSYNEALNKFLDRNNKNYLSTMTIDDARYNARGSMLRAFPTYCVVISDDNSNWYDGRKMWTNYYPYKSVVSISVFHEREQPVGTLKLSVTNLTNHLSKSPSKEGLTNDMVKDLEKEGGFSTINAYLYKHFGFILGSPKITSGMIEAKNKLVKDMKLQPGTRIHVRMGYGSNPLSLNVLFNGTIAEVSVGEILEMVAQSDGAELINNIVSLKENKKNNSYNDMGLEASSIISAMLTDRISWTNIVNPKWGEANKYNIEHFGHFTGNELKSYRTSEYDMCKNIYFGNYYKNLYCGGRTDLKEDEVENEETVKEAGGVGLSNILNQAKEAGLSVWKAYMIGSTRQVLGPIGDLIGAADNVGGVVSSVGSIADGAGSAEETIKMYVYNKTPWDVMQTASSTLPEFICQPMYHQFDSRIYFGLPTWLAKYRYDVFPSGNVLEQAKSFQQVHLVNYDDIIDNRMKCSNKFFNTNVVCMYNQGGELKSTPTMYSDRTIDWSKQKTKVINTNIVQDYFGPDILYSMMGFEHGKVAAIGTALTNLIDSYDKQYYDEIITLGKPGVKPCDLIFVNDIYSDLYGLANVRSVTHTFSPQTGFVTNITPGLISYSKIEDTGCSNSHNSISNFYDLISNVLEAKKHSIDKLNVLSPYMYQANINNEQDILKHCGKLLENPSYDIDVWIKELEKFTEKDSTKKFVISKEIRDKHTQELLKINNSKNAYRYLRSFIFRIPISTKIIDYLRYGNCIIARPLLYKNYPFISGIKGSENLIPGYSFNPYKKEKGDYEKDPNIEEFDVD